MTCDKENGVCTTATASHLCLVLHCVTLVDSETLPLYGATSHKNQTLPLGNEETKEDVVGGREQEKKIE